MPTTRTKRARSRSGLTPEAIAAFKAGDEIALHQALGLGTWMPSPFDVDGPEPPDWGRDGTAWRSLGRPSGNWNELEAALKAAGAR
jgi:hypothetical protein